MNIRALLGPTFLERLTAGGTGSGCHGENCGRPTGRAERARAAYVGVTREKYQATKRNEERLARALGGKSTPDNQAFDVLKKGHGVEVKTISEGKNDKITMHPESRARKLREARKLRVQTHTVVFDMRGGRTKIYYREGVGSYRLKHMELVTLMKLRRIIQ